MKQEAFFLENGNIRLYSISFVPDTLPPEKIFLFCHPLFEEKKAAHRLFVELSRTLADKGHRALMVDFRGCGDSNGDYREFIPSNWLSDIDTGVQYIRKRNPDSDITLIGVRFGAALALRYSQKKQDINDLILIDPVLDGEAYLEELLRQKNIREMMTFGAALSDDETISADLEKQGYADIDGVAVPAAFFSEMKSFTAEPPRSGNIFLIQESANDRLLPAYAEMKSRCSGENIDFDYSVVRTPPFWKAVDIADSAKIQQIIISQIEK